jgi:GMP synthase-like glutamine amidotransferase
VASCLIVQHLAPEGPYVLGEALAAAGVELDLRRVDAGDPVPADLVVHDGLIVMGGPMSATSDEGFATRSAELALLRDALERGRPVLGVCLGAQLLAAAGGGSVFAGAAGAEIGWDEVTLTDDVSSDPLLVGLPRSLGVLHWHGDTFSLPPGASHLASSERYANQAFRIGANAWGFQFHLEVDAGAVARFLASFGSEAAAAGVEPAQIEAASRGRLERLAPSSRRVGDRFAAEVLRQASAR